MKRFLSCILGAGMLFTTVSSSAVFASNQVNSTNEIVVGKLDDKMVLVPEQQLLEMQKKLEQIDRSLNPTVKDKICKALGQTAKSTAYYSVLAVIAAFAAQKAGYIKLPTSIGELKAIKFDKVTGAYGVLGLAVGPLVGAIGKLFGIPNIGFLAGPLISGCLAMYRTDAEPIGACFTIIGDLIRLLTTDYGKLKALINHVLNHIPRTIVAGIPEGLQL